MLDFVRYAHPARLRGYSGDDIDRILRLLRDHDAEDRPFDDATDLYHRQQQQQQKQQLHFDKFRSISAIGERTAKETDKRLFRRGTRCPQCCSGLVSFNANSTGETFVDRVRDRDDVDSGQIRTKRLLLNTVNRLQQQQHSSPSHHLQLPSAAVAAAAHPTSSTSSTAVAPPGPSLLNVTIVAPPPPDGVDPGGDGRDPRSYHRPRGGGGAGAGAGGGVGIQRHTTITRLEDDGSMHNLAHGLHFASIAMLGLLVLEVFWRTRSMHVGSWSPLDRLLYTT